MPVAVAKRIAWMEVEHRKGPKFVPTISIVLAPPVPILPLPPPVTMVDVIVGRA